MDKFLFPTHPVRRIIIRPSECGKLVFLTNLILNISKEYDKKYIYSPSLLQELYQKLFKCFNIFKPIHMVPNILNEENVRKAIEEIVNIKKLKKQTQK